MAEELRGIFQRFRYQRNGFLVIQLKSGDTVVGEAPGFEFYPDGHYRFSGYWTNHPTYGRQFRFKEVIEDRPLTRRGASLYLEKNTPEGTFGPVLATRCVAEFGADRAIDVVINNPAEVANRVRGVSRDMAELASVALAVVDGWRETKMELGEIFAGRGFPQETIDRVIRRWNVHAPDIIRRDPFSLLVAGIPGAGFLRCDRMYLDFGLPEDRLKRQLMIIWNALRSENRGSIWFRREALIQVIERQISGEPKPSRAIELGLRARWLAERTIQSGIRTERWYAERRLARAEERIYSNVLRLCHGV